MIFLPDYTDSLFIIHYFPFPISHYPMTEAKVPTGPKGNILFTAGKELQNNILGLVERHAREYPDISRLRIGPYYFVNLYRPEMIEQVLGDSELYSKGRENANLKFLLGNGLLTNEGEYWMKQRRLIQPIFHKRRLAGFVQQIAACTERLIADWQARGDIEMDIHAEMTQITLGIVSQTLLSTDASGDFMKISDALVILMKGLSQETVTLIKLPKWVPTPSNIAMKKNRAILDRMIYDIIAGRRRTGAQHDDLLTMLMEVEDADTAERMTDSQLRDEVITIFLAGHETTANAMSFALYLMARHPDAARRIGAEAREALAGGELTYESVMKLDYTTRAVKEAMRLYPPAWVIGRQATQDTVVDGYRISRGDTLMIYPYITHRLAEFWPDPLRFDPDRFLPERMKDRPRYAYFPFGGGARLCIGNNFAMMEMQIILALLCSRFEFSVPEGYTPEVEALVTLRPKGTLPLRVKALV
jgi:cytochrome P450